MGGEIKKTEKEINDSRRNSFKLGIAGAGVAVAAAGGAFVMKSDKDAENIVAMLKKNTGELNGVSLEKD